MPYDIEANGIVTPMQTAAVAPQVDGIILDVDFSEGQEVSKGQVLFHLDPRPYQAAFDQATATLARDKATAVYAQAQFERYDGLVKQGIVTREQADQLRANAQSAAATVQADQATLANAKFNLDNCVVRAPISGRTGRAARARRERRACRRRQRARGHQSGAARSSCVSPYRPRTSRRSSTSARRTGVRSPFP